MTDALWEGKSLTLTGAATGAPPHGLSTIWLSLSHAPRLPEGLGEHKFGCRLGTVNG